MSDTVTILGNVATDPTAIPLKNGTRLTSFRLASPQRRYDPQNKRWVDAGTNWYSVSAFRQLAENALSSLKIGDSVIVTGRLRLREWEAGGRRGISPDIEAENIGHDLRWGTSSYARLPRGSGTAYDASPQEHGELPDGGRAPERLADAPAPGSGGDEGDSAALRGQTSGEEWAPSGETPF